MKPFNNNLKYLRLIRRLNIASGNFLRGRDPAYLGQFLKDYEKSRYSTFDYLPAPQPQIIVPAGAVKLPDVSYWQGEIEWNKMDSQTNEVFLKVSQNTWKDEKFERNYSEAKKRGIFVGGYTFYDGRVSPDQQFNTINAAMQGKTFELEYIVDWEHSYGGSYEGLPNAVKLMKKVEGGGIVCHSVGMYTGYYWFVENSNAQANAAEYDYVKNKPLWLAWYASPDVVRIPPPWTNWTFWQFGTPPDGALYGVETVEIDMNKFNGDRTAFTARYGQGTTPPPQEVITYPYAGVVQTQGTLNGQKYYLQVDDMIGKRIRVVSLNGSLKTVENFARDDGAQIVVNADQFNKHTNVMKPEGMSYTDGVQKTPPFEQRYWMNISSTNVITWGWGNPPANAYNLTSFVEPVIVNGQLHEGLYDDEPDNREIHAWTFLGANAQGQLMTLVCEGFVDPDTGVAYAGCTKPQAAQLFKDKGAIFAGQSGGGGDTGLYSLGAMVNESSDRDAGQGWRGVVQVLETFIQTGGDGMGTIGTHKGVAKSGTSTNIKRMSDGFVLAQAVGGDVVWGEWNSAHTDFINFDHYFLSNGTRVELGVMCKCVTQNMTVTVQTEPTPEPPDPEPEPEPGVADMPYKIILGGGDSPYEETTLEGIVPKK